MKKILSLLLCSVLILTLSSPAFASTHDGLFEGYQEIIQDEFYQASNLAITISNTSDKVIIHNNGHELQSDYFVDGHSDGNHLIAVTYIPFDDTIVKTAHFSTADSLSEDSFVQIISNYETNLPNTATQANVSPQSTINHYQWTFPDPNDGQTMASLTTAVTCERKSSNSTVDGVVCSVWDVTTFSQLEKENAVRLNSQYTRLSVDQPDQHLIAYGPIESTSGGDLSVGLDGAGVPSVSYSFNIDGFSVENLSSMTNEYGRWAFIDHVGNEQQFTTQPGIRATNSKGPFIVELSHTVNVRSRNLRDYTESTGVIQIWVDDR